MSRRKGATPKERVLAEWPLAECHDVSPREEYGMCFDVTAPGDYPDTLIPLGHGPSRRAAWADAAKRLRGKR